MRKNPITCHMNQVVLRDAAKGCWLQFDHPREIVVARRVEDVMDSLNRVDRAVTERGFHAAGLIAYEAAPAFDPALVVKSDGEFPLVWFGLYDKPHEIEIPLPCTTASPLRDLQWSPSVSPYEYKEAFERIKNYIRNGDTYQVNYSFRLRASVSSDPWSLFLPLLAAQGPAFSAFVNTGDWVICSASPELFFLVDGDHIESRPMKGTATRGLTHEEDIKLANDLYRSEKDRAENLMIVDMVRNDIGRIADIGSVNVNDLYAVERYPTLWQMVSTVCAKTRATLPDIFQAMFPPASITGAPKSRTMEIIAELESTPRRVYTGAIGFIVPGRRAQFNVAIRTLLINQNSGQAEYGVGGGIVWDSKLSLEQLECRAKALVLDGPPSPFCLLETILWTPEGGYSLLDLHLKRLEKSAAFFGYVINREQLIQTLKNHAHHLPPAAHKVRLIVPKEGGASIEADLLKSPAPGSKIRVTLAPSPVDSSHSFLYHKTTNRQIYENAIAACPGYDDVILYNEKGEVTESTIANLVVEIEGILFTPPVRCGLLPGTYRAWMLERGMCEERPLTIDELINSSRVLLINSVRGIYEVSVIYSKEVAIAK